MRVLVACETSRTVARAFEARGHYALSCDVLPAEMPGEHYQGDVLDVLNDGWDLVVAHPPCTYLCSSGMHWTVRGLRDPELTERAVAFVRTILECNAKHLAIENPAGVLSSRIRKPDQYIQPYQFGDDASKRTGLWLRNLPKLVGTCKVPGRIVVHNGKAYRRWANQTDSGQNVELPGPLRWKSRSRTYPGIANAMAEQWGDFICG